MSVVRPREAEAQLLEFHWRENKAALWEKFWMHDLADEGYLFERNAPASCLRFGGFQTRPSVASPQNADDDLFAGRQVEERGLLLTR